MILNQRPIYNCAYRFEEYDGCVLIKDQLIYNCAYRFEDHGCVLYQRPIYTCTYRFEEDNSCVFYQRPIYDCAFRFEEDDGGVTGEHAGTPQSTGGSSSPCDEHIQLLNGQSDTAFSGPE